MKHNRVQETAIEITVGAFMFMVLLALGFFTIVLSRENLFKQNYPIEIVFDSVMGLREGDNVFVRGVDVGKVKNIHLEHDGVHVYVNLEEELSLREDFCIEILPSSVLGGRYLNIYEGSVGREILALNGPVRGKTPVDLIDEATRTVRKINEALDEGGILENLKATMAQIRAITDRLDKGQGTLGKLLLDDAVYNEIEQIAVNLRGVSDSLAKGEGTLGKLIADDKVYNDLEAITANLKEVSQTLASGEGTLGKLLSKDEKMYNDLAEAIASVRQIAGQIKDGKGTIGRLTKDEDLYDEVKALLREARAAIDDIRETAPVTTFTSVFFGAF